MTDGADIEARGGGDMSALDRARGIAQEQKRGKSENDAAILKGLWYFACPSRDLAKGAMTRRIYFGEPVVLGRTESGEAFALRDVCPHRAAPLSAGVQKQENGEAVVECPYHGWRFKTKSGQCAAAPALASTSAFDVSPIGVKAYPLHEANGLIWVCHGDAASEPPPVSLLDIGLPEGFRPKNITVVDVEGPYDEAVIGLVDPAHTPFVHKQWWWRDGKPLMDKVKTFEPTALGFKMPAHRPSSNTRIYKFIGGAPTTEIEFRLPGVRFEWIKNKTRTILGLTAITPTEPGQSRITHLLFWDLALLDLAKPIVSSMAKSFLSQDGAILSAQNLNLSRFDHRPLYVGDPDEPAKWYFRLKRAWRDRGAGGFQNPIEGSELHWRT